MYIIDYLDYFDEDCANISPFHTGHLGLIPNTDIHASILKSTKGVGTEICITPYYPDNFDRLFRLKCVLKDDRGVVHKLLKAISILNLNIVSSESVTLESKMGHGVSLLLDWSNTNYRDRLPLPDNVNNLFFPMLSNLIPRNDRRYLILLRQILGQCADVLDWTNENVDGISFPRINVVEFDETRVHIDRRETSLYRPEGRKKDPQHDSLMKSLKKFIEDEGINRSYLENKDFRQMLKKSGVKIEFPSSFTGQLRARTDREGEKSKVPFIALSDIESKTLRLFVPLKQAEARIVSLSLSHKNRPGALYAITKLLADCRFSIYSSLVRRFDQADGKNGQRNVFEATLEHESKDINYELLNRDPQKWIEEFFHSNGLEEMLAYFDVRLEKPQYPSNLSFKTTPLFQNQSVENFDFEIMEMEDAEDQIKAMKKLFQDDLRYDKQQWLTDLLFDEQWGVEGKPTVFISYPHDAEDKVRHIRRELGEHRFHFVALQRGELEQNEYMGDGFQKLAINRIRECQYFIAVWTYNEKEIGKVSPWMPFEFGVALGLKKPFTMVVHKSLSNMITRMNKERIIMYDSIITDSNINQLKIDTGVWFREHRTLAVQ